MKEDEQVQRAIFLQLTKAINDWMLEKYPTYDEQLEIKIANCQNAQLSIDKRLNEIEIKVKGIRETIIREAKQEIGNFLAKDYPDISRKLATIADDLKETEKKIKKERPRG